MVPWDDLISSSKAGEDYKKTQLLYFIHNMLDKIGLASGIDITVI